MDLSHIIETLRQDAVSVVFLNVLLQQIGLPVPAVPTLLLAGSLAASPEYFWQLLAVAVLASLLADCVWYAAGKLFGYRVLNGLCRLSINPSSCVSQTEARFIRWGLSSLVVAKFVPGFSTVAPPIAGALRMPLPGFLMAAGLGAALWAGAAIAAGWLLRDAVLGVIAGMEQHLGQAVGVLGGLATGWVAWKLWQKYRFRKLKEIPHIEIGDLNLAFQREEPVLLLDLRGKTMIDETGPIPGARVAEHDQLLAAVGDWPKDQPIVTLCACPEDAGAVQAAQALLNAGYLSVRPLRGGYEAWLSVA